MAHKVKTRRGKRRVSEKRFASKLTRPENNRPRNEKQAPTRETAFGAALRRALERRPPTAEERDFDAEWNLRRLRKEGAAMKRDLASLFDLVPLAALKDPPDRDVGGTVYVMRHYCYTVNAVIGNGGWQSEAIWTRQEAERAARALADWLGAEVTR